MIVERERTVTWWRAQCELCGQEHDTEARSEAEARANAENAGWWMHDSKDMFVCRDCRRKLNAAGVPG